MVRSFSTCNHFLFLEKTANKRKNTTDGGEGSRTHSSTSAWKAPWMEQPGRLQSMGSQRVRHG